MILNVHELQTTLIARLRSDAVPKNVVLVRPRLYRHASPAGTVVIQLQDDNGNLIATSNSRSIAGIGTGTYWHGYADFTIAAALVPNTVYRWVLVQSGYTFGEPAYLGWCNAWDSGAYEGSYGNTKGYNAPFDLQVWSREQLAKGVL